MLYYIASLMLAFFSWNNPEVEYGLYCTQDMTTCWIDQEYQEGVREEDTIWRAYPTECVNGRWIQTNRTGWQSGSENVFDVGPWNSSSTTFGGCSELTRPGPMRWYYHR